VANDTGSTLQTVFVSDLQQLNYNPQAYAGNLGVMSVQTASGDIPRAQLLVELQIVDGQGEA
jgi:hypothetical protein